MKDRQLNNRKERLTMAQKKDNNYAYYRERIDALDGSHNNLGDSFGGVSEYRRMKTNYDLFNNQVNLDDLQYVCKPFGDEVGELPADMKNRDIISGKIKVLLGMESKRPFDWNIVATNPTATSKREEEEMNLIKDYVKEITLMPIKEKLYIEKQQQALQEGQELTEQQLLDIQKQVQEEAEAMSPERIKKYMMYEYQDPMEVQAHQLLEYLSQEQNIPDKFLTAFKHGLISGKQAMYVGILNGKPVCWNVNSMRLNYSKSPDTQLLEDSEEISVEYRMTTSEVIRYFGDELTESEIERLYENVGQNRQAYIERWFEESRDNFFDVQDFENNTHRVLHGVWKGLRQVCFLNYIDIDGQEKTKLVSETYELKPEYGDISIDKEWIPETYETWKIDTDIYVNKRPLPGQLKSINNLGEAKGCYYGVVYDNMNSQETSLLDRMKYFQYLYNIIIYRIELLTSSDKGKKVLMNINSIPSSTGLTMKKWQYFSETTPYMWFDLDEEGKSYNDVNTVAKVLDLSLASDISKYIEIAEYIRQQCGKSVGITDQVEGQIEQREAVGNTQQALIQTSYMLEPYFQLHAVFKKNVLTAMIETAKVAYSVNKPEKLAYVLDDMSVHILDIDVNKLDMSDFGIFLSNSSAIQDIKNTLNQYAFASLQNGKVGLADVLSVLKQESLKEAEIVLRNSEQKVLEQEQQMKQQQQEMVNEENQRIRDWEKEKHEMEKEKIVLKEEERRKTVIQEKAILGASFNPDLDADKDGVNDFIEIAKDGVDADIKVRKQNLEEEKFEHQKRKDAAEIEINKLKINKSK